MAGLTIGDPATWAQAMASNRILPGDVLLLRGGNYAGTVPDTINGTEAAPVIIKSYPGELAVFNDGLTVNGTNLVFQDVEIAYPGWTTRTTALSGSNPADIPVKDLQAPGANVSFLDCRIHDLRLTFFSGVGGDITGCHIYNIGWLGLDRGHGHGIYSQNGASPGAAEKQYRYNIVHDCYGWGFHVWDETSYLSNYLCEYNISFKNGSPASYPRPNILHGGGRLSDNVDYKYNYTHGGRGNELGYSAGLTDLVLISNYWPDGVTKVNCTITEETDNYYGSAIGNQVFVLPYKTGIAHVAIYNQAGSNSVSVDLSTVDGLSQGDTVHAHNAQDYDDDIQTLTLDASEHVTVNLQAANRSVEGPIGGDAVTSFPDFGCFIVRKA